MSAARVLAAEEFHAPGLWLFRWDPLFSLGPVEVTKPMVLALVVAALVVGFFAYAFARPQIVPRGVQNVGEMGYLFIRDHVARGMIGKEGDKYVPLLFTLFFMVWIFNIMSIVPVAQFPVSSRISYPAVLAVSVWLLMVYLYIKHQGIGFLKKVMFPPGLPWWIYPLLAPIEFVSTFIFRPFTHAVRLFANMFAGHILIALFAITGWHFLAEAVSPLGVPVGILGVVMTIAMTAFELLIQFLQAYIFVMLTATYIAGTLEAQH